MRKLTLLLLAMSLLAGCAKRPETASPDYANYLATTDNIAAYEASRDQTIFHLTVGDEPVVLPPGTQLLVRAPGPPLPMPQMWRDHAYEAELAYYGTIWNVIGGVVTPAAVTAYGMYNNRKMIGDIMRYAGGATFQADNDSQIIFSGGWGDRSWGYQGGSFSESLDLSSRPVTTTTTTSTGVAP